MSDKVWAVVQQRGGSLHPMSREAITAAVELAGMIGGEAEAVVLGDAVEGAAAEAARYGASAVRVVERPGLAEYTPGAYAGALAAAAVDHPPRWLVLPHTYQSVDYMPLLARRLDAALVSEAIALRKEGEEILFRRPIFGGKLNAEVRVRGEGPVVVSVQSGAFPAEATGAVAPVSALEVDEAAITPDREVLGIEEAAGEHVDLSQAPMIVAVGRGIGGPENIDKIEALAAELGAEIGASRPVIDSGWLPRDRQIGSSGQTVSPKLYLAVGISGAIQHLVGMKGSRCVVAINKDASAPIFALSRYGIVADLHEVLPALTEALREAKAS